MPIAGLEAENKHLREMVSLYSSYIEEYRKQVNVAFAALLSIAYEDFMPWTMNRRAKEALNMMYPDPASDRKE